jgi:hypothetical protein
VQRRARRRPENLVCAVADHAGLRLDRLMSRRTVTRCDAGTEAESTGVRSRAGWAVPLVLRVASREAPRLAAEPRLEPVRKFVTATAANLRCPLSLSAASQDVQRR